MRTQTRLWMLIAALLTMVGCASHVQRGVSSNLVEYLYPKGEMPDHRADALPHLTLPLKVGLAFIPADRLDYEFLLTEAQKQRLLEDVANRFKAQNYIQHIEIIPELYLKQGKGFNTVEQVARLHDVDVMALVSYDQVSAREENWASLMYWTIVGAYIIPGESTEVQTFVDTAVFDVKTKKLLFRAPGIHTIDKLHQGVGANKKIRKMKAESFNHAVVNMSENLSNSLAKFKQRVKKEKIATVSYRKGYSGGGSMGCVAILILLLMCRYSRCGRKA